MSKQAERDRARKEELRLKIWGIVAKNLLKEEENPYLIRDTQIESHKGRFNKALRLSKDIVSFSHEKRSESISYRPAKKYYKVDHFDRSKDLAQYPKFLKTWQEYHREITSLWVDTEEDPLIGLGYRAPDELAPEEALYVYWHLQEFEWIIDPYNKKTVYFPKVLKDTRLKAMLRAMVEDHFQMDFVRKLERYLDLPKSALKDISRFTVEVRNFAAHARCCSKKMYEGEKGFLKEYKHYIKYFQALEAHLRSIIARIKAAGGYAHIVREMRKDSIRILMDESPLHVNYESDDHKWSSPRFSGFKMHADPNMKKYVSLFILRNPWFFNYNALYANDESIQHIEEDHIAEAEEDYSFDPPQGELDVISKFKQGIAQEGDETCLMKEICES